MRPPLFAFSLVAFLVAGCSSANPDPASGDLIVTITTSGTPDPNGYTVTLSGHPPHTLTSSDTTEFTGVPIGNYTLTVGSVEAGCTVTGGAERSFYIYVGIQREDYFVTCP